jgi:hypothetical protein
LIDVVVQVNVPLDGVIAAIGAVVFVPITELAVAVQPLEPVTVTLYVPPAVTVLLALVELLSHKYVPPPLATKLIDVVAHVNVPELGVIAAVGAVVLVPITELAVAVQPLEPVTVTLYVPPAVTVLFALVELLSHK